MGIIYFTNKKTGITYAYENEAYWDKEKRQSRAHRKLIGKVDPHTGEIIPTRPYHQNKREGKAMTKPGPVPITEYKRSFCGASCALGQIGKITGIEEDLSEYFAPREQRARGN